MEAEPMIVEFPFVFEATVILRRGRTPKEMKLLGMAPVDVPELASSDIVDAARLTTVEKDPGQGEIQTVIDYRISPNGGLMRPLRADLASMGRYVPWVTREDIHERIAAWMASPADEWRREDFALLPTYRSACGAVPEGDVDVRSWLKDNRGERLAELLAAFRDAAFVDGVMHVPSEGPGMHVYNYFSQIPADQLANVPNAVMWRPTCSKVGILVYPELGLVSTKPGAHGPFWSIAQMAEVQAAAEALVEKVRRKVRAPNTFSPDITFSSTVDVFPGAVADPQARLATALVRAEMAFAHVGVKLADLEPEAIIAYGQLKREWRERRSWTAPQAVRFAARIEELQSEVPLVDGNQASADHGAGRRAAPAL